MRRRLPWIVVALVAASLPALAQETRREVLEAERAARARQVAPYEPGRLEGMLLWAQRSPVVTRLLERGDGWYPVFGSVTRGGGPAFGAGWRRHFASDAVLLNATAVMSTRGYRTARVELRLPRLADGRLELGTRARHRDFPQEDYFGLGPDSRKDDRVDYRLSEMELAGFAVYRPVRWLAAGGQVARLSPRLGSGTDARYPALAERFDERTAPGLAHQPSFLETGLTVEADFRDRPGNPRSGGRYSVLVVGYDDRGGATYDFTRTTVIAEHHVPIFDKKRIFSVRGVATHLDPQRGRVVPFYYMPAFGGRDTLRGLLDYRFRDRAWAVMNAEYRWEAVSGLEMALFYDVGDVGPSWGRLSRAGAWRSYGLAARINTSSSVILRTEVAFGSGEGTRAYVAFGAPLRVERYLR